MFTRSHAAQAWKAFEWMEQQGGGSAHSTLRPDVRTYNSVVAAAMTSGHDERVGDVITRMLQRGIDMDEHTRAMIAKRAATGTGGASGALRLLEKVKANLIGADVVAFNAAMGEFMKGGGGEATLAVLSEMESRGVAPDMVSGAREFVGGVRMPRADGLLLCAHQITARTAMSAIARQPGCGSMPYLVRLLRRMSATMPKGEAANADTGLDLDAAALRVVLETHRRQGFEDAVAFFGRARKV